MNPMPLQASSALSPWEPGILSLTLYAIIVFVLAAAVLFLTGWLGSRNRTPAKAMPYESGCIPTPWDNVHYWVQFYLVATFFLIFDVEAAYIFSWAVAFERLGWLGWLRMTFFILVLLVSLFYVWTKGGLEWGPSTRIR
ncbi:MAG: NADH-quinone oxidoreductase subunit A [Desulfobacteraceae bacterium]|nr:NADH-quinone oxidoreductase subunit A [Desulfobacteraceae bacterium]